ncbi:DUF2461 domain-containing protein [uncultured Alistipes sp.]|uniref:DUF2461 domain-containing protein n=1 Tax=uncultured Alistipes sp. TaxID=538949 RepID=UPI0026192D95|nr:DUF2461 domain-containing protein [uncultured Alistipes sp.]
MKNILTFLDALRRHNDRTWFEANKSWYRDAKGEFDEFVGRLIVGIASFDAEVAGLDVRDCTYRIYRDTRFSADKSPYKTHMGAYVCRGGKKSGYSGYYFHLEPRGEGFLGGSMIVTGMYMPSSAVLRSIREEIVDNGEGFLEALAAAEGFRMNRDAVLRRVPAGFPADSPYAEYLKLKNVYLERAADEDFLLRPDMLERTVRAFETTLPFNRLINRAVEYAYGNE